MPSSCAVLTTSTQAAAGSLPLVSTQRTSSSRISAAVPGMVSSPASRSSVSHSRTGTPAFAAAVTISIGRERVHVHARHPRLDRPDDVGVAGDRHLRVDAALQADLGGAGRPRLLGPVGDLLHRQPVRVGVALPLGERAEPAPHVADVGEVDVPVDHVGDVVADRVPAQRRRRAGTARPAPGRPRRTAPAPSPRAPASSSAAGSSAASRRPARRSASAPPARGTPRARLGVTLPATSAQSP